jgi:hypothetical protein
MPLKFWDEAFLTDTYLINMLPSKVIDHETPIERLLHKTPDYASLRTFGCACWPNLCPFNKRKLAFRSKQCAFIGYYYSPMHKGVKCLDIKSLYLEMSYLMKWCFLLLVFILMSAPYFGEKSYFYLNHSKIIWCHLKRGDNIVLS